MPDRLGASHIGEGRSAFVVWAPKAGLVEVVFEGGGPSSPLEPARHGYHRGLIEDTPPGSRYRYRLDGEGPFPDPASRSQPDGVNGPSEVVDPRAFEWSDSGWVGLPLRDLVFYELHVGTFTAEGTLDAVVPHLDGLVELGVTAVEIMPVAQFPGQRNWGYDGVYPYAVQNSYGGPAAMARLVDECHRRQLAVVLDVVYNHIGPEGNYLPRFGPYFTNRYRTPWGKAINLEGPGSDEVRRYFIENALRWFEEFHVDALRLDAVHGIIDPTARPFLKEMAEAVHDLGEVLNRRLMLIAESGLNDARLVMREEEGGFGLDALWADDLHHSVHTLLTGERRSYYRDYGRVTDLAKAYRDGFVYTGQYSENLGRRWGNSTSRVPAERFVVCAQNHDQVGNRMMGERLGHLVDFEAVKVAAGAALLSPFVPLLFMGEEYAEEAPFLYFVDFSDPKLVRAIARGRRAEFASFGWKGRAPDPQDPDSFERSKLHPELAFRGRHRILWELYRELLRLRRDVPALAHLSKDDLEAVAHERERVLQVRRWHGEHQALAVFNFGAERAVSLTLPASGWTKRLESSDERWGGPGARAPDVLEEADDVKLDLAAWSFVLYTKEDGG